ncbi:hypothetical protein MTO96_014336 [Rhipicephalus appendiculatus]
MWHSTCLTTIKVEKSTVAAQAEEHSSCPATLEDVNSQQRELQSSSLFDYETERLPDRVVKRKKYGIPFVQQQLRLRSLQGLPK